MGAALGWKGGKDQLPGVLGRCVGRGHRDSATLVLNHRLDPSPALPFWHSEPLMTGGPLLGCPFPESRCGASRVAKQGPPLPAPPGKMPGPRGGRRAPSPPQARSPGPQLVVSSWLASHHLVSPRAGCQPSREEWGEGEGPKGYSQKARPCPGGGRGVRGAWVLPEPRPVCKEAVDTIAMVGNPHWISVRTTGIFKRERSIYIYEIIYTFYRTDFHTFSSRLIP